MWVKDNVIKVLYLLFKLDHQWMFFHLFTAIAVICYECKLVRSHIERHKKHRPMVFLLL